MTDNKNEVMDEYPERYIERKGKSVLCQITYSKSFPWVCYDLEKGQEFLAEERMGAIMEIDLRQYRYNQDTRHTPDDRDRVMDMMAEALNTIAAYNIEWTYGLDENCENIKLIANKALAEYKNLKGE